MAVGARTARGGPVEPGDVRATVAGRPAGPQLHSCDGADPGLDRVVDRRSRRRRRRCCGRVRDAAPLGLPRARHHARRDADLALEPVPEPFLPDHRGVPARDHRRADGGARDRRVRRCRRARRRARDVRGRARQQPARERPRRPGRPARELVTRQGQARTGEVGRRRASSASAGTPATSSRAAGTS